MAAVPSNQTLGVQHAAGRIPPPRAHPPPPLVYNYARALAPSLAPASASAHNSYGLTSPVNLAPKDKGAYCEAFGKVLGPLFNISLYHDANPAYPFVHIALKDGDSGPLDNHANVRKLLDDGVTFLGLQYNVVSLSTSQIRTNAVEYRFTNLLVPGFKEDAEAKDWLSDILKNHLKLDVEIITLKQELTPSSYRTAVSEVLIQHAANPEDGTITLLPSPILVPITRPNDPIPQEIKVVTQARPGNHYTAQFCQFCKQFSHPRESCIRAPECTWCGSRGHQSKFCSKKPRGAANARAGQQGGAHGRAALGAGANASSGEAARGRAKDVAPHLLQRSSSSPNKKKANPTDASQAEVEVESNNGNSDNDSTLFNQVTAGKGKGRAMSTASAGTVSVASRNAFSALDVEGGEAEDEAQGEEEGTNNNNGESDAASAIATPIGAESEKEVELEASAIMSPSADDDASSQSGTEKTVVVAAAADVSSVGQKSAVLPVTRTLGSVAAKAAVVVAALDAAAKTGNAARPLGAAANAVAGLSKAPGRASDIPTTTRLVIPKAKDVKDALTLPSSSPDPSIVPQWTTLETSRKPASRSVSPVRSGLRSTQQQ